MNNNQSIQNGSNIDSLALASSSMSFKKGAQGVQGTFKIGKQYKQVVLK